LLQQQWCLPFQATTSGGERRAVAAWGSLWGGEERRFEVGARSALRYLLEATRRNQRPLREEIEWNGVNFCDNMAEIAGEYLKEHVAF
jgi:hypothetical protein